MRDRRRLLSMPRDHLVHVLPRLQVSGAYSMICECAKALAGYHHSVIHQTPLDIMDLDHSAVMQAQGLDVLQVDEITPEAIDKLRASAAILYNVQGTNYHGINELVPSIYYSYGLYDTKVPSEIVVPCSEYAAHVACDGTPLQLDASLAIAPIIDTRAVRQVAGLPGRFTIGMITSYNHAKYNYDLAFALARTVPSYGRLLLTIPPQPHQQLTELLNLDARTSRPSIQLCSVKPLGLLYYTVHTDVLVYGTAGHHYEPYGRTVVEAMAMGKAVVCERRGVFASELTDRVNAFLFDTPDEAAELAQWLSKNTNACKQLGANAQLWAARQDTSIHAGRLKRVLRMIGA